MSTQLAIPQSFEEKLRSQIKEKFADLIDDATLKAIIERGIEDALFKQRTENVPRGYGGYDTRLLPPFVQVCVSEYLDTHVKSAVDKYIHDNPTAIQESLNESVKLGIAGCIAYATDRKFQDLFYGLQSKVDDMLNKLR